MYNNKEPKFTLTEFIEFKNAYYNNKAYPNLRFGQAFFSFFKERGMDKVVDPKLFYEAHPHVAEMYILSYYIQDTDYDSTH